MNILDILLKRLPLSRDELLLLIATAPNRYKEHTIEKRNNRGKRLIAQPTSEVKLVQTILQATLRGRLPVHPCAKAYQPATSIKDHALPHASHSYLLKVDFKDFFPSIKGQDFSVHLKKHAGIDEQIADVYARVFFWRPRKTNKLVLAIGAPSSPWISNTILFDFDSELSQFCHERGVTYTRYADDLALSTNTPHILEDALEFIRNLCRKISYPQLTVNEDKTVFTSKKYNRTLTGLVLSNDGTVSIGRAKKREIRANAKSYAMGRLKPEEVAHLRGVLAFTFSIDRGFNLSIARMIGEDWYAQLMK